MINVRCTALRATGQACMLCVALVACGPGKQRDPWKDIDYSSVYRAYERQGGYDTDYQLPSVVSCVNEDLYNCN